MKVTLDINGTPTEVELTEANLLEIEAAKKPKQFEFTYPTCYYEVGSCSYSNTSGKLVPWNLLNGRYRLTPEAAQQSLDRNRRANRLEALADQLGGLLDWGVCGRRYFIALFHSTYEVCSHENSCNISEVYMTEDCATKICRMLNAGEFEL